MRVLRNILAFVVISLACFSTANAREPLFLGINVDSLLNTAPHETDQPTTPMTPFFGAYGGTTYHYGGAATQPGPVIGGHFFDNRGRGQAGQFIGRDGHHPHQSNPPHINRNHDRQRQHHQDGHRGGRR